MRVNLAFDDCNSYFDERVVVGAWCMNKQGFSFDSLHLVVHKIFNASGIKNVSSGSIMWIGKKYMKELGSHVFCLRSLEMRMPSFVERALYIWSWIRTKSLSIHDSTRCWCWCQSGWFKAECLSTILIGLCTRILIMFKGPLIFQTIGQHVWRYIGRKHEAT